MSKDFDINSWKSEYLKTGGLSDDEKAVLDKVFSNESVFADIKRGYNSVSEGTRLYQEAKTKAEEAEAKLAEADQFREQLVTWQTEKEQEISRHQREIEWAKAARQQLQAADVDPDKFIDGAPMTQPQQPAQPAFDEKKFAETIQQQVYKDVVAPAASTVMNVNAQLYDVEKRYKNLTGKDDFSAVKFHEEASRLIQEGKAKDYFTAAEQVYSFGELEKQKQERAVEAEIERRTQERLQAQLSNLKIPSQASSLYQSADPIFGQDFAQQGLNASQVESQTLDVMAQDKNARDHFMATVQEMGGFDKIQEF